MIILLGPDSTGKSTLAQKFGMPVYHFIKESNYEDYLEPLCSLELSNAVLDRFAFCEYPYTQVMNRKFKFTMKQWHNIILLTLIQKPLIVLCTHKPSPFAYSKDQYLPYDKWDECLHLYRHFLGTHQIPYIEYDYAGPITTTALKVLHDKYTHTMDWWKIMWEHGWGCIGSTQPKVLLVAERLGPNNTHNIPFEIGPTGYMLTDMFTNTGTPLNKVTVTNLVKAERRSTRYPNTDDYALLSAEIQELCPQKVVFMGSVARYGTKVAKDHDVECHNIVHLGYHNYKRTKDMTPYYNDWKNIMGIT